MCVCMNVTTTSTTTSKRAQNTREKHVSLKGHWSICVREEKRKHMQRNNESSERDTFLKNKQMHTSNKIVISNASSIKCKHEKETGMIDTRSSLICESVSPIDNSFFHLPHSHT